MGSYLTNQIMYWGASKISDHNRSPLEVEVERIERKSRMASGTLRKYLVAQKRTWTCSWDMLPTQTAEVVDGGLNGPAMETFNTNNNGKFVLTLRDGAGVTSTYNVMLADFSYTIVKRGNTNDFWDLSVTLEEI